MGLVYQIALTKLKGVGSIIGRSIVDFTDGDIKSIFIGNNELTEKVPALRNILTKENIDNAINLAEKECEFISKNKIQTYFITDKEYPHRLAECPDAPLIFYTYGNIDFNKDKFISIIGTRNSTHYGKDRCEDFIKELAESNKNVTIVSGLAYGIDIIAHRAALKNNIATIGVVAHGLDRLYPSSHRETATEMLKDGGLLTEFTSGTRPEPGNFVQRNRIVAGLCDATIVIESKRKGGALITAEMANSYNREVFAFPGRTSDQVSQGCNRLIQKNKASLIQSYSDFADFIGWTGEKDTKQTTLNLYTLNVEEELILTLLQNEGDLYINTIARKTNLPLQKLLATLIEMEFKDLINALPGSVYSAK